MSAEEMDDMEMDMDAASQGGASLFWSMKLEPNKPTEIDQPAIPEYIVHVTNACFGVEVKKGSRSCVMVNTAEDISDDSGEAPVCVLRAGQNENQSLDLLFNESATITVKGTKASTVYLSGYLQPPIDNDAAGMMDPSFEDMDEAEIEAALRRQKQQQQALDDEEDEEEPELMDEDDEVEEPPTKKQKTNKGSKATKNGDKSEKSPKRKSPQQKPKEDDDDKKEEKSPKKSPKGDKKMKTMKGGLKYRDMKVGQGREVRKGDKLEMYYVGQLDNKSIFDKTITGKGFEFTFGKGEVIKGWDLGLKGMKKGGKRKLIIPANLGYGSSGSPPAIPKNAQLTFTIELKNIR